MSDAEFRYRLELKKNFPLFAERYLRIRSEEGKIVPFRLNRAQLDLHRRLEAQRRETGRVRCVILKARQLGFSTYVQARFFWRLLFAQGYRAFIMTHHARSTDALFGMAKLYYQRLPEILQPELGNSSQKELTFANLHSGYKVGTAGTEGIGRGETIQLFHASEAAFWPDADNHLGGALQAVPEVTGTEIIFESTANGIGNAFHKLWQGAEGGESDDIAVFYPWYWKDTYARRAPKNFKIAVDEIRVKEQYKLTDEQIYWRRLRVAKIGPKKFMQEFPSNATEAFQTTGGQAWIDTELILDARREQLDLSEAFGATVFGVDPARFGDDETAIVGRRGRKVFYYATYHHIDTMQIAGRIIDLIGDHRPDRVFIDVGGLGAGTYDRLRELGWDFVCQPVNFGGAADDAQKYKNKRAEMWGRIKGWLEDPPCDLPDEDILHSSLITPFYDYDSVGRVVLEAKKDIKKRVGKSPNLGDALALTFAYHVAPAEKKGRYNILEKDGRYSFMGN